jgi:double-strand break repair protein MRE11
MEEDEHGADLGGGDGGGGGGDAGDDVVNDPNVLRIMVSTDNHLGYMERDAVRGHDSFLAFDEVLATARAQRVDLVLLAGDLFHENKPSRLTMYR